MKNPPLTDPHLITKSVRGELSDAEQRLLAQRLRDDPAFQEEYTEEQRLESLLHKLPNAPVSSNFTSLVLQAALREPREIAPPSRFPWIRTAFARVATGLALVTIVGILLVRQYRQADHSQMAESVSAFTEVASVMASDKTSPEVLFRDFEAIQHLAIPSESELDLELLVALQK
jgi:anti-sigma factor RsiW